METTSAPNTYDRSNNTASALELNKPTDRHPLGRCGLCESPLGASVTFTDINDERRVMIGSCCQSWWMSQGGGYYY